MDSALKQRLIGAAVLVALAMIFVPMLLQGPDVAETDAARLPLDMPEAPDQAFETRELPLAVPQPPAGEGGVLGATPAPGDANPDGLATVVMPEAPVPRMDDPPPGPAPGPTPAVDAASGMPLPAPATTAAPAMPTPPPPEEAMPAPAPAAPEPPLPASSAGGRYAVNVGSFGQLDNARSLAERLRAQGLPVTTEPLQLGGKPALRVRVGPYAERARAEAARLRVEGVTGAAASVVTLDAEPAPAPSRAAATGVGFAVQIGALRREADAIALRDRARAAGFTAFHQATQTDAGTVYRVRVGPEADRAAADRLREQVAGKLGVNGIVVPHP